VCELIAVAVGRRDDLESLFFDWGIRFRKAQPGIQQEGTSSDWIHLDLTCQRLIFVGSLFPANRGQAANEEQGQQVPTSDCLTSKPFHCFRSSWETDRRSRGRLQMDSPAVVMAPLASNSFVIPSALPPALYRWHRAGLLASRYEYVSVSIFVRNMNQEAAPRMAQPILKHANVLPHGILMSLPVTKASN